MRRADEYRIGLQAEHACRCFEKASEKGDPVGGRKSEPVQKDAQDGRQQAMQLRFDGESDRHLMQMKSGFPGKNIHLADGLCADLFDQGMFNGCRG
jgi:hypothetical protein